MAPADTDEHLLAIADRGLASRTIKSLDGSLVVYNVLSGRRHGHREQVDRSAILSLRRLQVLMEVLRHPFSRRADPLADAWVESLGEAMYYEYAAQWEVRREAFHELHEKHGASPFAEEILWAGASRAAIHDCEGDLSCGIKAGILDGFATYWQAYPRGRYIDEAVEGALVSIEARDARESHLNRCRAAQRAGPTSREAKDWKDFGYWEPAGRKAVQRVLDTLSEVAAAAKAPLVDHLEALRRCAAALQLSEEAIK